MRSRESVVASVGAVLGLACVLGLGSGVAAQSTGESPAQAKAVVQVGSVQAQSGSTVVIPVSLATSGDVQIGAVEVKISFPPKWLKYKSTVAGAAGSEAGVKVGADETPSNDETVLRLTITLPPGGAVERLPNGVLADVSFDIAPEAEVGSIILKNTATAWSPGDAKRAVTTVTAEDGWLDVEGEQKVKVFGCFFYMH